MVERRLPNFIICGGQRCGTGWIAQCLREHPEVFVAQDETRFFDLHFNFGQSWWLNNFFAEAKGDKAIGEKTAEYLYDETVPDRIFSLLNSPSIIICVRDPVKRLVSEIVMKSRQTRLPMKDILACDVAKNSKSISRSRYAARIREFQRRAESTKVLVLVYEELKSNPEIGFREIFEFLGVDNAVSPKSLHIQTKPGSLENRNWILYWFVRLFASRSIGLANLYSHIRKESNSEILELEQKIRSLKLYNEDIEDMENLLGRELKVWRT